jgi:hypothetical protein
VAKTLGERESDLSMSLFRRKSQRRSRRLKRCKRLNLSQRRRKLKLGVNLSVIHLRAS